MIISPARRSAFEILRRVEEEDAYASVLLATLDERLREDDRALSHELVLGVLRRRMLLDRVIEHYSDRPTSKLDLPVRLALRLALYQLRFLTRIPASAAVNESVNLARAAGVKSAAGFVNAVLRRAAQEPTFDPTAQINDEIERLAVETSHPRWLIERWSSAFGRDEAARFARANNQPPPISFRLTSRAVAIASLCESVLQTIEQSGGVASQVARDGWRASGMNNAIRKLASDGLIYFQDEASQMVAHILNVRPDNRVLDVAGAPGSKATHVAMIDQRVFVVAADFYEHRAATMQRLAVTQGTNIHIVVHDATRSLPFSRESFDRVLLDAPCSGTGTLRRNPEIRYRLKLDDIADLAAQQLTMLSNAATAVRPGGRLIYSTCSVEVEENEAVIQDFLSGHRSFARKPIETLSAARTKEGDLRTWPQNQNTDGFFISVLERTSPDK